MRRTLLFSVTLVMMASSAAFAQKKPLDHSVYDSWETTSSMSLTDDGRVLSYQINRQEGDPRLVFENLGTGRSITIDQGTSASVSRNGNWAVFKVKAPYAETRKARIKKLKSDKMPKDTLKYIDLRTFEITSLGCVNKHFTVMENEPFLAYEQGQKDSAYYVLKNLETGRLDTLRNVGTYTSDRFGRQICIMFKKDKKDSLSTTRLVLYNLADMSSETISEGKENYYSLKFNHEADKIVFLASDDKRKEGPKHCGVYLYQKGKKGSTLKEVVPEDYSEGFKEGWFITEKAAPRFSRLSDRLFLNISAPHIPKDTTIIEIDMPQIDIWNWDNPMTPTEEKLNNGKITGRTLLATVKAEGGKVVTLAESLDDRVTIVDGGQASWALVHNDTAYQLTRTWDSNRYQDIYTVDVNTGERKPLFIKNHGGVGVSPTGKYLYWFNYDDLCAYTYNMATGAKVNLTGSLDGVFYNDEDDHPDLPTPFAGASWYDNDEYLLLTEKYDLWKIRPDGTGAVNMTQFEGRSTNRQFRFTRLRRSTISGAHSDVGVGRTIGKKEYMQLTVFDRNDKKNGFAYMYSNKPGVKDCFTQGYNFQNTYQALNSDRIIYRKGNFNEPLDVYVSDDSWKTERKLSAINPQMADYLWGDVQLVKWNAYDGTPLQGLLYTPEDYDPNGSYPMIVYFYELNSHTMYTHYNPAPSRSIVCVPFYTSRGYVVFIPDIVYKDGHPGECAYNCICSGAEAMCDQFKFIDRSRMAIQGQSWGGYQTAYLVTRTDMFAAAEAGAPVGNMTSAYGGIRWGSGVFRAMQYEHGQSRIGKSLWDEGGRELYIENSPIFHADKVTTPLLIMHNDNDGAVPWYQGIEMFMAVRRQQKPVWLLQYNREAHNLNERRNCKDLSIRMQQFFDHYLKGEPMPAWMKDGVPYSRKGQYLGYETE